MKLYLDLSKAGLNTTKLVKKPVQVKGKNGRVYTRMQWVDPTTGQPVNEEHSKIEQQAQKVHRTQKEHIDSHIKNMSNDEKYHHINKHGITWKHNDHPQINHKNAVMALKDHFYKNPHLAGADHLPKEVEHGSTPDGTDRLNEFVNAYKKHPELLYKMMRHLGIVGENDPDPRTIPGHQHTSKGGNGMGDIAHMRNMMALKRYFKENPSHIDDMLNHNEFGAIHDQHTSSRIKDEPKKLKSRAQQGGNTIKGILDAMSREDKYKLIKHLGISESDPAIDPSIPEKMRPIHHMRNLMALKKSIEQDPSILNLDTNTGEISEEEKERINSLKGVEKASHDAKEFLDRASKNLKLQWADDYTDHEHMKNRSTSNHENIDNMHKISALKKILTEDPSLMEELSPELEHEELMNIKIGNKDMGKFLRRVAGIKGVGDVVAGFNRGKQWEFGVDSSAEIVEDDEGEPVLSVLDTGKDGEDYNEMVFPLKDVKKFLEGLKEGKASEVKKKEIPLEKKAPPEIWKALEEDFNKNYTPDVGDALKSEISKLWRAERTNHIPKLLSKSPVHVSQKAFSQVLKSYGVPIGESGDYFDYNSDAFKRAVYGHLIEDSKTKNATKYLQKNPDGSKDTWLLHESAKKWSPDQRIEARKDMIKSNMRIAGLDRFPDAKDREVKIVNHIHTSLEHVPFDLMTDILAKGCKFNFYKGTDDASKISNYFSTKDNIIQLSHAYISDSSLDSEHPMQHKPSNIGGYGFHPFSDTMAHEFAHAMDFYLSGGRGLLEWDNPIGQKYTGKHTNVVDESYSASVKRSNPSKIVAKRTNGNTDYYFHLDQWMSNYEGRIYSESEIKKQSDGTRVDTSWNKHMRGVEHWSENVSRTANALHAYNMWKEKTGDTVTDMNSWASQMHDIFLSRGYGDDSNSGAGKMLKSYISDMSEGRNKYPLEAYGYLYHAMSKRHPELHEGIKNILLRPDFIDEKDSVKKSTELIINL